MNLVREADAEWVLGATSAVPFAFRAVVKDQAMYMDGGAVDNMPIAPLLSGTPDYIIVVMLDDRKTTRRRSFSKRTWSD